MFVDNEWKVRAFVPDQELEAALNGERGYDVFSMFRNDNETTTVVWRKEEAFPLSHTYSMQETYGGRS